MSGYEGEGTDFSGGGPAANENDNGGTSSGLGGWGDAPGAFGVGFTDANIGVVGAGIAPNAGMSLAGQYAEYGAGRSAADLASGVGIGANGASANQPASKSFVDYAKQTLGFLAGVFGLANPSPVGKLGGASQVFNAFSPGGLFNTPRAESFDLGFTNYDGFAPGAGGTVAGLSGSTAPDLFAGTDGPPDPGFLGGVTTGAYGGGVTSGPLSSGAGFSSPPPSVFASLGAGGGPKDLAGFVPGQPAAPAADPLLLIAGAASLFFLS